MRVGATGEKIWYLVLKVRGQTIQKKIGAWPDITVSIARQKAAEARIAARAGGDTDQAIGRPRRGHTVRDLFDWWIANYAKARRKTWEEDARVFDRYLAPIANRQADSLTKSEARQLHHDLGMVGHATANRTWEMLRTVYNRAIKYDFYKGANPTEGVDWFRETSRERALQDHEVARFFEALDKTSDHMRDYVLLSLFTGQRKGNVLAARWDQVDWEAKAWTIPTTKNGKPVVVYLEALDLELLKRRAASTESEWVFPSTGLRIKSQAGHFTQPQRPWEALCKAAGIKDLHLHDLRRTLGSWMADTGSSLQVIGKTLGHDSPTATLIYARLSQRPLREAKALAQAALSRAAGREAGRSMEVRAFVHARVRAGVVRGRSPKSCREMGPFYLDVVGAAAPDAPVG